jgi:hypothetical protein
MRTAEKRALRRILEELLEHAFAQYASPAFQRDQPWRIAQRLTAEVMDRMERIE